MNRSSKQEGRFSEKGYAYIRVAGGKHSDALFKEKVEKMVVCAILPDGGVFTGYIECDVGDKATIVSNIQAYAVIHTA